jgi:anti-sigma factor RsiW
MRDGLTKRDWEIISAYLDGQLSARKQARFESRLQQDQQLRDAYEELRATRQLLRNAPKLRAPRSFMLSPEMASQPHRLPRLAPVFGWAAAVASFFFVLFLVGDLFTVGGAIPMALNNLPQQQVEFVGIIAESDATAPEAPNAAGMEESAQPMAEMPASETQEDVIVVAPNDDGEPVAEPAAAQAVEPAEATEESVVEEPASEEPVEEGHKADTQAEPTLTRENPDASVTFGAAPFGETVEVQQIETPEQTEIAEVQDSQEPREGAGDLLEVNSTTEPSPVKTPIPEAQSVPFSEEEILPAEKAVPDAFPTEPAVVYQAEDTAIATSTPKNEWGFAVDETTDESSKFVIGAEVILGLSAVGAGLAWFYLRRRGG